MLQQFYHNALESATLSQLNCTCLWEYDSYKNGKSTGIPLE